MANGSRHSLYAVKETSYNTPPTNPALSLVRNTGVTLGLSKDSLQSEEIRSDRQIADFRLGANQVGGQINFELSYGSFDDLLLGALLGASWVADTPASGTQQAKVGQTRQSFTFVRHFADLADKPYWIYKACEITSLALTISANAMITGSFTVVGTGGQTLAEDLSSLGTPTFPAGSTTEPLDSFTGTLKAGGQSIAVATEITLNLDNGINPRFVVGSKNSILPELGRSNVTGQITAFFESAALVETFINETDSSLEFEMPDTAGNKLKIIVPRIKYTGGQPDVAGEGSIVLTMPFQALLHTASATNLIIERTPKP